MTPQNSSLSVFISKNESEIPGLLEFARREGVDLIAQSFLEFTEVPYQISFPIDCVFFGSPRAFEFFNHDMVDLSGVDVACAGSKTGKSLNDYEINIDFQANDNLPLNDNAKNFGKWASGKRVLFPTSNLSLGTYSDQVKDEFRQIVVSYNTLILEKFVPKCKVYFFTSPSNVEGFLKKNKFENPLKIFAWGSSTSEYMLQAGIEHETLDSNSVGTVEEKIKEMLK
jgi:uroporphyrinogen-III synthase